MTVISKTQRKHEFPNSNVNSDTESLYLASTATSETESLNNEPIRTRIFPSAYKPSIQFRFEDTPIFHKHGGKRKLRRYQNCTILQTLNEDESEEAFKIFEPMTSPLSKLLQDPVALEHWNQFIEKSEEEQKQIIDKLEMGNKCEYCTCPKAVEPFSRISSKIRRTLKIRKNLSASIIKTFEEDVVHFFNKSPEDAYVKYPDTSFDRLLTHAIAQYHCLHSFGEWENDRRKVIIHNIQSNWTPTQRFLYELISEMRS